MSSIGRKREQSTSSVLAPAAALTCPVTFSVVVPVYNSADSLEELARRLDSVFEDELKEPYEVIFVDDGSPNPDTWPTVSRVCRGAPHRHAVQLIRNFGAHNALLCGFAHANGEWVITMDDDLQHRPEDIPALLEKRDHDVVIGAFGRKKHHVFKRLTSRIKGWFDYKLIGKPQHIKASPFKLIRRDVVRGVLEMKTPYPFIMAMLCFVSRDIVNVQVTHEERKYGRSGFTLRKMVGLFSNLLINNSSLLLRFASAVGLVVSVGSFLVGGFVVIKKLTGNSPIPGWASLVLLTSVLGGLMLFSLGVIGEYLIRIISSVESRPAYIVRQTTSQLDQDLE